MVNVIILTAGIDVFDMLSYLVQTSDPIFEFPQLPVKVILLETDFTLLPQTLKPC